MHITDQELLQAIYDDMQELKQKVSAIEAKVNRLGGTQSAMRNDIIHIDRKISDTYNLALDAWSQGVENKELIERSTLNA